MSQTCILDPRHRLLDATPADRLAHTVRTSPLLLARPSLKRCAPSQRQSAVPDAATARTHTSLYQTRLRLALYMHLHEAPRNTSLVVTMRYLAPTSLDQFGKLSTSTACAAFQDELEPREPDQDSAPGHSIAGKGRPGTRTTSRADFGIVRAPRLCPSTVKVGWTRETRSWCASAR